MSISVAHYQPIESRHSAMNNEIYARSVDFTPSDYIAAPAEWSTHPQQPAQESYYFQESHNAHAHFDRHHHHQPSNQLQQQRYQHHHEQQQQDHPMTRDVSHSMSPSYSQSQSPQYHEPVQDSVMFGHTNEYPSTASLSASPTMVHTHFGDSTSSMLAMSASNLASWQANYSQESQGSISHERKSVNNNEYVYRPRQPLSPETMSFSPLESEATTLMSSITPTPISGQSPGNSSSSSKATAGTSTPTKAGTKAAASATKARRASTAVAKSTAKATGVKASRSKSIATTSAAATLAAAAVAHEQQRKRSESTSDMDDQEDMEGQDSGGEGGEGISDKKRQHYLERNRLAASKSRDKKRKQTARLMENSALITSRNQELHQTLDSLQDEVRALKNQILCHRGCDCMALQEYIQNSVGAPPPSTQPSLMSTSAMVMSLPMSMSPTMSSQLDHHAGHDGHFHHLNQIQQHAHFDNPTQYSTSPRQSPTLGQMEL